MSGEAPTGVESERVERRPLGLRGRVVWLVAVGLLGGVFWSVAIAWGATRINWSLGTPNAYCLRAWQESGGVIGVEMVWREKSWVPEEYSRVFFEKGFIVRRAGDDPEWPEEAGPHVRFTGRDTYSAGLDPRAGRDSPPEWYVSGVRALKLTDAFSGERNASGWPCSCLEGFMFESNVGWEKPLVSYWCSTKSPDMRDFPLRPVWGGMVVNVAVWGGLTVLAVLGAERGSAWLLRRLRRSGDGCRGCGYSRRGLGAGAPCPECGDVGRV